MPARYSLHRSLCSYSRAIDRPATRAVARICSSAAVSGRLVSPSIARSFALISHFTGSPDAAESAFRGERQLLRRMLGCSLNFLAAHVLAYHSLRERDYGCKLVLKVHSKKHSRCSPGHRFGLVLGTAEQLDSPTGRMVSTVYGAEAESGA